MLRLTVDASAITGQSRHSGLGHYTANLLAALARRDDVAVTAIATADASLPSEVRHVVARRLGRSRYEAIDASARFSMDARRAGGDVFHVPAGLPPMWPPRPWVHTLHDVIPLEVTEGQHASPRRQWRTLGPRLRRADAVVAVSAFTADAGIAALGLDPGRVTVIPNGVDPAFTPGEPPAAGGADPPYLLVVAELSHRKGLDRAVAVIDALADRGYPHVLRVVGNVPPAAAASKDALIASARHPERLMHIGYAEDLVAQYRGAVATLSVARYEGFGLPAAEAMACGTPVVAFANTSVSEVVGDGGLLVPDGDIAAMTAAVTSLLDDPGRRAELRARAITRATALTWDRAAAAYVDVYRTVLGTSRSPSPARSRSATAPRRAVLFDAYPHVLGGSQRSTALLATEAPARSWQTTVATPATGPLTDRLDAAGATRHLLATPPALSGYGHSAKGAALGRAVLGLPAYWWRAWRWLRATRPSVAHIADVRGLVLVGAPTRLARIPMVWQVHAIEPDGRFHRLGARWASVVVVPSSAAVELLPSLAAARRLVVAPVPFPESVRREAPVDLADGIRLVTVARLHPEKGIDVLVDALPAVRERHPAVVAQVVGGPHPGLDHVADDLAWQARDLDVAANLELLGFHDRPHEVVARGRVYVHPARSEVLPIAVLEAMATGVPVVATDVGGTRELIEPGVTGMLVPPDDPAALAAAIVAVLDDPALADRLRLAAFARVAGAEFTTAAFVDTVVACWEAAAGEG